MSKLISIVDLKGGDKVRIAALRTKDEKELRKLTVFGMLPGAEIEILQTYPSYVLRLGYTQFALDYKIAQTIMVNK